MDKNILGHTLVILLVITSMVREFKLFPIHRIILDLICSVSLAVMFVITLFALCPQLPIAIYLIACTFACLAINEYVFGEKK